MKPLKPWLVAILGAGGIFLLIESVAIYLAWPRGESGGGGAEAIPRSTGEVAKIEKENAQLRRRLQALAPQGVHIVVDSAKNLLYLKKGNQVLRQAVVSCGSGSILEEPGGRRKWIFDTPRGEFEVKSKIVNPTWVKPDWAFIEEGKEVPKRTEERLEPGVLGDYALGFGNGYFIHGTLYTRLLGRNVTHGCIRVGDEDLEAIYKAVSIGTKIFVF